MSHSSRLPQCTTRFQSLAVRAFILLPVFLLTVTARAQDIAVSGVDGPRAEVQTIKSELPVKARVASGELPPSALYPFVEAQEHATRRLPPLTEAMIKRQSSGFAKRNPVGLVRDLSVSVARSNDMTEFVLPEGKVRVLRVVAEGAKALRLRFENFNVPQGSRVFVYSAKSRDQVHVFQGHGLSDDGVFWTPPLDGEVLIVEYVTPEDGETETLLPFKITQVSHIYKDVSIELSEKRALPCHAEVPEEWKSVARSVGLMQFVTDGYEATCTGTLLNARNNDLTPYFLTAHHCVNTAAEAQSVSVRWFYDSSTATRSSSFGATLLATGAATDYTLLMLNGALPPNLRWAGWTNVKPELSTPVIGIHHPAGDYKRFHTGNLVASGCPHDLPMGCENVHTMRFTSGMGEPGTSGSGIWIGSPSDPLLIGQNFGGNATCSNPQGFAWYGRFDLTYSNIANFLQGGSDDEFEGNDSRAEARGVPAGMFNDLVVKSTDEDWYRVTVPAGMAVTITTTFTQRYGDVNLQVFRAEDVAPLSSPPPPYDLESVVAMNNTNAPLDYLVRVYLGDDTRNLYSLKVTIDSCVPTLTRDGVIRVTIAPGCNWTAQSDSAWLIVDPWHATGTGNGIITYRFNQPSVDVTRTGTITVNGQSITITQPAVTCNYRIAPVSKAFGQSGGTGRFDVMSDNSACRTWSAASDANWVTITVVDNSLGGGSYNNFDFVAYSVTPNPGTAARTATLTIAGRDVTVTQAGADPQWQPVALSAQQMQFKVWREETRLYAYLKLILPSTGYRVADWGQVIQSGNSYTVDLRVERSTGAASPIEVTTAAIYYIDPSVPPTATFNVRFTDTAVLTFPVTNPPYESNPINDARRFVQEQYRDFLSREPDEPGWDFWTREITSCGFDFQCTDRKRTNTSGAFFLSDEFQVTGYYVYRLYKGALNRSPYYSEFVPDIAKVASGIVVDNRLSPDIINRNKVEFAREFVARAEFLSSYNALSEEAFVDRLFQTTGVRRSDAERQALVDELRNGTGTLVERRASVLKKIVDGIRAVPPANGGVGVDQIFETSYGKAFYDQEFNRAFVLMQYFGYLKRDPDAEGYQFWLAKLNRFGNFTDAEMVKAFIVSAEYRSRFGQP